MSDGESKPVKGEAGENESSEYINLKVKGQVRLNDCQSARERKGCPSLAGADALDPASNNDERRLFVYYY